MGVMRGTDPKPMVPEMPTESDSTPTHAAELRADGGDERREEAFGSPLVPDYL
jgi:hypothetical protein